MLAKEAWRYGVSFINRTVGSWLMLVEEKETNTTVGTVAILNLLMNTPSV